MNRSYHAGNGQKLYDRTGEIFKMSMRFRSSRRVTEHISKSSLPFLVVGLLFVSWVSQPSEMTPTSRWIALLKPSVVLALVPSLPHGCGTDLSGNPTDDRQCGALGTNPYNGESATDLTTWCGGKIPGSCKVIRSCNPQLASGSFSSHKKYYLPADLNCGASSLAILMASYVDLNLNGHTVTGAVFLNGSLKGFHFFNGVLNCAVQAPTQLGPGLYTYGCLANENNAGSYKPGGGDQISIHHISGQNSYGAAWFIRLTGHFITPTGGWTEYAIKVYNNTFQSIAETTAPRQHAGVYSEDQPIEYFNNLGDCGSTGVVNACQILELYSDGTGSGSYVHNNKLTCAMFNVPGGDSCRPILVDGSIHAHVQYNDIYPLNNRAIRLRDAFDAEVDHNFVHELISANGYNGAGIHAGDNDINSGRGAIVSLNIHNNTFELAANGEGIHVGGQRGLVSLSDIFSCHSNGCPGAHLLVVENWPTNFGYPVTVDAIAKTVTQSHGNFKRGVAVRPGSVLSFVGFANPGNNRVFTVTAVSPKTLTLTDPTDSLVNETSTTKAGYFGVVEAALYNPIIIGELTAGVKLDQSAPIETLKYCGARELTVHGTGSIIRLTPPCP